MKFFNGYFPWMGNETTRVRSECLVNCMQGTAVCAFGKMCGKESERNLYVGWRWSALGTEGPFLGIWCRVTICYLGGLPACFSLNSACIFVNKAKYSTVTLQYSFIQRTLTPVALLLARLTAMGTGECATVSFRFFPVFAWFWKTFFPQKIGNIYFESLHFLKNG